jgi:hypothetical protein
MTIFVLLTRTAYETDLNPDPEKPLNPTIQFSERPEKNPRS